MYCREVIAVCLVMFRHEMGRRNPKKQIGVICRSPSSSFKHFDSVYYVM